MLLVNLKSLLMTMSSKFFIFGNIHIFIFLRYTAEDYRNRIYEEIKKAKQEKGSVKRASNLKSQTNPQPANVQPNQVPAS